MATPNPDALRFALDVTLPERLLANRGDDVKDAFTRAVLALDGVASVFGVNDFVTVTRVHGAEWVPIIGGVEEAAARYLGLCSEVPSADAVARARDLLRAATRRPAITPVEFQPRSR